jgi:hypothetical protein
MPGFQGEATKSFPLSINRHVQLPRLARLSAIIRLASLLLKVAKCRRVRRYNPICRVHWRGHKCPRALLTTPTHPSLRQKFTLLPLAKLKEGRARVHSLAIRKFGTRKKPVVASLKSLANESLNCWRIRGAESSNYLLILTTKDSLAFFHESRRYSSEFTEIGSRAI